MRSRVASEVTGRLEVADVSVSYDGVPALRSATFDAGPGEVVGIVGPNGAGKSTLVKAILGLVALDSGSVRIDGHPVGQLRRHIAYLPQRSEIDWDYPAIVEEVVTMGRYVHRGPLRRLRRSDRERVKQVLERVGMSGLARTQIGALSGGQQQRVFLARALAQEARLLLLDEPFAGIDALTEQVLNAQLNELRDEGATAVVISHDLGSVGQLYDRVLILSRRVVAYGRVDEVFTARNIIEAYGALPEAVRE